MEGAGRHHKYTIKNYSIVPLEKTIPSPKGKNFEYVVKVRPTEKTANRRCHFMDSNNNRCKVKLGLYPILCEVHSIAIDNLYIKESKIPNSGYGLFAGLVGYKKGDIIGEYSKDAIKLKMKEIDARKGNPDSWQPNYSYVFCENEKRGQKEEDIDCWDALDYRTTIMRYANDAHVSKFKNNCYFEPIKSKKSGKTHIYIIASRNIGCLEELYLDYSDSYW